MGDALACWLLGISVFSISACALGSFAASSICCRIWSFFACFIFFLSLFLYLLCACMFLCVGYLRFLSCSICCFFIILFSLASHHLFLLIFGFRSCCSTIFLIACCMRSKLRAVVCCCAPCRSLRRISSSISWRIFFLFLWYLCFVSVFSLVVFSRGAVVRMIAYVGRWSDSGGDMVPAVICALVSVVSIGSMSVCVLYLSSYLVGVVIVVCRLFSSSKWVKLFCGWSVSRLMLISPITVSDVRGVFVFMVVISSCKPVVNVAGGMRGLLYVDMIVWIGSVLVLVLWICSTVVATSGCMLCLTVVMCMLFLKYTVISGLCMCLYPTMG